MFDYILTGRSAAYPPDSTLRVAQRSLAACPPERTFFGIHGRWHRHCLRHYRHHLFLVENTKGVAESSEKALHIMKLVTVMVVLLIGWCIYTALLRHSPLPPFRIHAICTSVRRAWLACAHGSAATRSGGHLYRARHSVLAMSGEESLAQVYREIESPS